MASLIKLSTILMHFKNHDTLFKRGENSITSGNVKSITFDESLKMIRGEVNASMKQRSYKIEIRFTDKYEIERATCECPRGLEICHHIAAILLASHYEISKTDGNCSWTPGPSDSSQVQTIDDVFNLKKVPRVTNRDLTEEEIRELFEKLQDIPPVGFRWILRKYFEDDDGGIDDVSNNAIFDSIDVRNVVSSSEFVEADNKTAFLKEKLKLSPSTILEVSKLTIGQSNNVDWFMARKNRITASNFGKIISAVIRNRFPLSLFSNLHDNKDLRGIKAIDWGINHEKNGIEALQKILKNDIASCGIFLSESGVLGASSDGIVDADYIVEVKCPFKFRKLLLSEALKNDVSYCVYYDYEGKLWLNKKHPYYHQVQGQMYLSNSKGCHLCIWTPKQVVHCLISKDEKWACNLKLIEEFYFEKYVPYILSKLN